MKKRTGYLIRRGKVYYACWTVAGKKFMKTTGKRDRREAETELRRIMEPFTAKQEVDVLRNIAAKIEGRTAEIAQIEDERNPPLRIKETWTAYLKSHERPESGKATLRQYEGHWTRFDKWITEKHPDAKYLRDVTPTTATEYAADLSDAKLSGNRFNKHIGFLKLAFRVLADTARISENPFEKIKRKNQRPHSRRELTIPELTLVLDRAEGDLALLLYVGATTGLRLGDCCTLTWGEVDLALGIVRRIPNKTAKNGKPVILGIPSALLERLVAIPKRKRTGSVLPGMAEQYGRDVALVTNAVKKHFLDCGIDVHAPNTGQQIKRDGDGTPERDKEGNVITEATDRTAVVDVGFHSLRHTWVSMHAAVGTPGAVIQASVGHSNPAMTAHYTHVNEITARDVARALPVFAGETSALPPADALRVIKEKIGELAMSMTAKTWKKAQAELLMLTETPS